MIIVNHGLPQPAIEKIISIFRQHPKIENVILYGSRALGNFKKGSDIDLCIVSNSLNLTELFAIETQLGDLFLPWKIDLSLKSFIDNQDLLDHINQKGVLFYQLVDK